jgi:hypothetical protein
MSIRLVLFSILALVAAACASSPSPQVVVYDAQLYVATGQTALKYMGLPRCDVAPMPCSKQAVVDGIKRADAVANVALRHAQEVVRTPGFGNEALQSAAVAATGAVKAFVAIVPQFARRE